MSVAATRSAAGVAATRRVSIDRSPNVWRARRFRETLDHAMTEIENLRKAFVERVHNTRQSYPMHGRNRMCFRSV